MKSDPTIPLTPYGARLVLDTPHAGWTEETLFEARRVLSEAEAGPLTARHLDMEPAETAPDDPSNLGRFAECFEVMHGREDDARLGRWLVGAAVAGALLIGLTAWLTYPAAGHEAPAGWSHDPACISPHTGRLLCVYEPERLG